MPLRPLTLFALLAVVLALAALAVPLTLPAGGGFDAGGFDRKVRAYLLTHPEVIVESVNNLRQRNEAGQRAGQAAALRAQRAAILDPGPLPVAGNPKGDVTVVEFFDYRCPYCRQAHAQVKAVLAADRNVRLVLKEFPVLGPDSLIASRVAVAASMQGKYHAVHDALMTHPGNLTAAAIFDAARGAGVDMARLEADMARPEVEDVIRGNLDLARRVAIGGTPTFIIGEDVIPGYADAPELLAAIKRARRK